MILRLQHIGIVVRDLRDACARFERVLGMPARDFRDDQGQGMQLDARILLGNECWLHLVQNWNPETRVSRFLRERGEGLEHICIETDSIEADVAHLRDIGVGVWEDRILDANDGYEAFVYPDRLPGLTVELIESHDRSWVYPSEAVGEPVSTSMRIHTPAPYRPLRQRPGWGTPAVREVLRAGGAGFCGGRGEGDARGVHPLRQPVLAAVAGKPATRRLARAGSCASAARGWNTSPWRRAIWRRMWPGCGRGAFASSTM